MTYKERYPIWDWAWRKPCRHASYFVVNSRSKHFPPRSRRKREDNHEMKFKNGAKLCENMESGQTPVHSDLIFVVALFWILIS
jgi:hypothetical protein